METEDLREDPPELILFKLEESVKATQNLATVIIPLESDFGRFRGGQTGGLLRGLSRGLLRGLRGWYLGGLCWGFFESCGGLGGSFGGHGGLRRLVIFVCSHLKRE